MDTAGKELRCPGDPGVNFTCLRHFHLNFAAKAARLAPIMNSTNSIIGIVRKPPTNVVMLGICEADAPQPTKIFSVSAHMAASDYRKITRNNRRCLAVPAAGAINCENRPNSEKTQVKNNPSGIGELPSHPNSQTTSES
jgi:hypothetical protein